MTEAGLDQPAAVRPQEQLDRAALAAYLQQQGIAAVGDVIVEQFPRGFSNLTYLVTQGGFSAILRRPPFGVGKGSAHDVVREARLLSALGPVFPLVPRIIAICEDPSILGAPFYLMERASGIILRDRLPDGLSLGPATMRRVSEAAIATLASIHAVDYRAAGLDALGRPEGYVERQVNGWNRRYLASATGPQPDLDTLAAWLERERPIESAHALVHNDFKYDNLVLAPHAPDRVVAVLDWEMATIGDPLMDLGTTLAYWVERTDPAPLRALGLGVTSLPGNLTREEVVSHYAQVAGREVPHAVFYYAFGLFKVAIIAQQIYARFVKGLTADPRFARLDMVVAALGRTALEAIARGRVSAV